MLHHRRCYQRFQSLQQRLNFGRTVSGVQHPMQCPILFRSPRRRPDICSKPRANHTSAERWDLPQCHRRLHRPRSNAVPRRRTIHQYHLFVSSRASPYTPLSQIAGLCFRIFNIPRDGPPTLGFSPRAFPSKSSTNVGAIVGGTVGGVAFVIICGLAAFWFLRRRADRRLGPFEIEDADKPVQHEGVEPYMVGAPTPAQPSLAPSMPMPTQPLLLGEESAGPLPPPSYEEASSSAGSPISPRPLPIRDLKTRVRVPSMSMITESSSNAM